MAVFRAFKPEAMNKIAKSMGYTGNMSQFQDFIEQDPARQARMEQFKNAAVQMAKGGVVKMQQGGVLKPTPLPSPTMPDSPAAPTTAPTSIGEATMQRMSTPGIPQGGVTQTSFTPTGPAFEVQQGTGELTGQVAVPTAMASTAQSTAQQETAANTMTAATAAPAIEQTLNTVQAAQLNPADPRAQVTAAQQTASSVGNLSAAQGNATLINNPVQRNIQAGD